jgi:hypothetical protein
VRWVARSVGEARGHARRVPTDPFADRGPRGWVPGGWHVGIVEESAVYTLCAIAAEVKTDPIAAASLAESRRLVCETWVSLVCGTWVSHTRGSKSGTHGTLSRAAPYGLALAEECQTRMLTSSAGAGAENVLVAASNKVAKLVEQLAYQRVLPQLHNGPRRCATGSRMGRRGGRWQRDMRIRVGVAELRRGGMLFRTLRHRRHHWRPRCCTGSAAASGVHA